MNNKNLIYSKNLLLLIIIIGIIGLVISLISFFNNSLFGSISIYYPYVSLIGSIAFSISILYIMKFIINKEGKDKNLNYSKNLVIISIILNILGDIGIIVLNRNIYGQLTSLSFLDHLTFLNEIASLLFYISIILVIVYFLRKEK